MQQNISTKSIVLIIHIYIIDINIYAAATTAALIWSLTQITAASLSL